MKECNCSICGECLKPIQQYGSARFVVCFRCFVLDNESALPKWVIDTQSNGTLILYSTSQLEFIFA